MPTFDRVLDLFLQRKCPLCQRSTPEYLCTYCERPILACRSEKLSESNVGVPLFSWGMYDDALKRAIGCCKYQNQPIIAEYLGKEMGNAWQTDRDAQVIGKVTVVPIPMHRDKLKKRGFNQAEILAKGFCHKTNMSCRPDLLQRTKNTKPQMETKSKTERQENLNQAFTVSPQKLRHPILLIDDIYTSGATIEEAIKSCSNSGMKVVGIFVLARTALA